MIRTVAKDRRRVASEDADSRFDLGTAVHAVLLEGRADLIVSVDAADWRTNAAKAQREDARKEGKLALLAHHADRVLEMAAIATRKDVSTRLVAAGVTSRSVAMR